MTAGPASPCGGECPDLPGFLCAVGFAYRGGSGGRARPLRASGMARGIIEPATQQFQHHQLRQDSGVFAMGMIISRAEFGGTPDADVIKEDPLELLMRLRSVTAAQYAGEEKIREARCRKIAVAVSGTTAVFTVWADGGHVRKIQAVTQKTTERIGVTVLATATVTVQLWDFGVPVDSVDWPPLPPPAGRALPVFQRRLRLHPPRSQARRFPGQVSDSWSKAARRPARTCLIEGERFPVGARAERPDRHHPDLDRRQARPDA